MAENNWEDWEGCERCEGEGFLYGDPGALCHMCRGEGGWWREQPEETEEQCG